MALSFPSALIRHKRLERNWSQEGLCAGLCAVSYLSKIEQGKAEPNADLLHALMERLQIVWYDGAEAQEAGALLEELWEAVASLNVKQEQVLRNRLEERREIYLNGPHMLDVLLLERLHWNAVNDGNEDKTLSALADCFDQRQRAWYYITQERHEEAALLMPEAYVYLGWGASAYYAGDYTQAVERLLRCCTLAAEEGRARVLLHARMLLGNCYSDQGDVQAMRQHYAAARRLAHDLNDMVMLETIGYNEAATDMQLGHVQKACIYFESIDKPSVMALHKLAICLEKLDRGQEAMAALDRAAAESCLHGDGSDYPDRAWANRMCALVRYRLEHPRYLRDAFYGNMLLSAYRDMQCELPHGYVLFHQPWVEEWYVANRQYKQAYEMKKGIFHVRGANGC